MKTKWLGLGQTTIGLIAATALLAACTGDDDAPDTAATVPPSGPSATATASRPAELTDVTLGYSPILIYSPIYVAIDKGYFADEGINLKLERISGGSDILTQTAAGNFQIGASGLSAATFNAASAALKEHRDVPFEVVSPIHFERAPNNTPLVVSQARFASGEITSIADLKGKKVAINAKGTGTEYALERALQAGGLSVKDVSVQALSFNDMGAALANKAIDGAMLAEPQATLAKDGGFVTVLNDTYQTGDASSTALYWNREWARKNPDLAAGFLRAYLKAAKEMEAGWSDPATVDILTKYTKVPADVIARASRPHFDTSGRINTKFVTELEGFFRSQDELIYDGDLDLNAFIRKP
ncbi:MAG TPA: ABC transporter substrate-binding protein [Gemmatimonadales bacterium]|nr:ABC transporter substrate-binding protein [Gemmatimonadales bacterium]